MSTQLKQLISDTRSTFSTNPDAARAMFHSTSRLTEGFRSGVSIRQHKLAADEPPALGGADSAPTPVELILAALGTCQEITYRAYATAMGIPLDAVSVELTGDLDLRGFFAVDESVRAGYQRIRGTVHLESSAGEAELQKLRAAVDAHCPVLDILTNKVPVSLNLSIHSSSPKTT
jgi:putative redox protein